MTKRKPWFENVDPPHRRIYGPRLFRLLSTIRRYTAPQGRRELGLSDFEWRVMSQVGDRAPMSLNELAAASSHDKGQLSRGVKRLVEAGLLVRESRRGERGVFISPTAAGRKVFDDLVGLAFRQNDALIDGLSPDELETFSRVIEKIQSNCTALLAAEPEPYPESLAIAETRRKTRADV
ncbi:MAG TPA: MarR family winged helix-turn-helix transcriptional regulator [Caulobacteraceae bacterium]